MTGRTISHYRILDQLGAGGMGVVYKAHDTRLDRLVALKFPPPHLSADPAEKHRFVQEARAASALDHPNIGVVYDIDETPDGQLFIAMAYYEGATLKDKIAGGVSMGEAVEIARQIAQGLAKAHEHGIVHRDIKPGNVILTTGGVAKIIDFGLAKLTGATVTLEGTTKGTVGYMSPEQALGKPVDHRTDLWSLGVVLYEMLSGQRPFDQQSQAALLHAIAYEAPKPLREVCPQAPEEVAHIVERALQKDREKRYSSAAEMARDLAAYQASVSAPVVAPPRLKALLRPRTAIPALLVVLALATLATWLYQRSARVHWAREQALPEIGQLAATGKYVAAFHLARQAESYIPSDPALVKAWDDISTSVSIETSPSGADVEIKEYSAPEDQWMHLGKAPIGKARIPVGYLRWRISKPGFGTIYQARVSWAETLRFKLDPEGAVPEGMVRVPGGPYTLNTAALGQSGPYPLQEYFIDRYEVTNAQFKEFVNSGGYQHRRYWKHEFLKDGRVLSFEQALAEFRDATGRPGPATWEAGRYQEGQDNYPVAGVSWYEAAAYAEFAGKNLPTIVHWYKAAERSASPFFIPLSNFASTGPAPVGKHQGISPYGAYDMAGNVKEWCWNETGDHLRFILGGSWREPSYMFLNSDARPPLDRSPTNGFRCARYTAPPAELTTAPRPRLFRDYAKEKPVSDEVFRIYRSLYAYDRTELKARLEATEQAEYWWKEKISFDAAYGNERVPAYLFLPKNVTPPYQTVVFFPGANVLLLRSSETLAAMSRLDFIIKSGRAVLHPIYKETYERRPSSPDAGATGSAGNSLVHRRDRIIQWSKDLGRALDYLETRKDIDRNKLAYMGNSMGSAHGPILVTIDGRLKACIFLDGGFYLRPTSPEIDQLNFAPRLKAPTLMVNGRYDFIFPPETSQRAMFRSLGTPEKDKRYVVLETAHDVSVGRNEMMREVLTWLDRYLGKVK
jgi:formylglycine-generating enzyme required for sulfatase activity/dienelactone hydrolase